jgi:MFS family permease
MVIFYTYRKVREYRKRKAEAALSNSKANDHNATTPANKKPCPQCIKEKSVARKYRWKLLSCLLPAFFLSSLDLTIVATALPEIASHFDKFNQLNWIVTSFTLTDTAFIPVWGQLADIFGRHSSLQAAVFLLMIGSVFCAAAPSWGVLLFGRALQGIGAAGIQNVAMIVLADLVSLKEQAVNTSIFQLLNGVGYAVGPIIGGYLTNSDWRYCFALSAGMSFLSMMTIFLLRKDLKPGNTSLSQPADNDTRLQTFLGGLSTLDIGGIILFILGVGLIILGTAWGGSQYAWSSSAVIVPIVSGVILLAAFVTWETLLTPTRLLARHFPKTNPMIPAFILNAKDVQLVSFIATGTGAALYSVFYFIGIYFTLVEGYTSGKAGQQLLYYVPGLGVGVYGAIFVCNFWPRQTFFPLAFGTVVETAGIAALSYAVKSRNEILVNVMMPIAGIGTGMRMMPSNLHLAGMFRDRLAPVYSLLRFAMPFGGTLALTVMGSVFQNKMSRVFGSGVTTSSGAGFSLHNSSSSNEIAKLPAAEQEAIRAQGASATMWAFISILPILGLTLVASQCLGNVWISKRSNSSSGGVGDADDGEKGAAGVRVRAEDGICGRHALAESRLASAERRGADAEVGAATAIVTGVEPGGTSRGEVDVLEGSYLLALMTGRVRQLRRPGPSESGDSRRS